MNPRTAVSVTPAGRRVNVVGNDNILRSRGSSEGDTGEGEGQESDEGQTGHGGGKRQNRVAIWGRILCSRVQYMRFQVMRSDSIQCSVHGSALMNSPKAPRSVPFGKFDLIPSTTVANSA